MSDFHPAYFQIAFRTDGPVPQWPERFVIITAYATTGESWSEERNIEADQRLHAELLLRGCKPLRITGYDPHSGHAEPGWAVELPMDEALTVGRDFLQDSIFAVLGDSLLVARCNAPWQQEAIGGFRERVGPGTRPLILHIPHASTAIPLRDGYLLDDDILRAEQLILTDWHTDDLFGNAQDIAVVAPFSRLFCDTERFTDDAQEVMAQYGMGVCYTRTDDGREMRRLEPALRERILRTYYAPHHQRLSEAVNTALAQHGSATIIDCHSYPGSPLHRDLDKDPVRPDYNIGIDTFHTPPELIERSIAYFAQAGYTLGVDRPYRGTLVPMAHYRRDARVRSIMLEVNRDLYMRPGTVLRSNQYAETKAVVQGFLDAMREAG